MADRYLHFTGTAPGRFLSRRLGLPQPAPLRRWTLETPALEGPLLHLTAGDSTHADTLGPVLAATGLKVTTRAERPVAVVLDATGVTTAAGLADVHAALHPVVRSLAGGGRVVVLGTAPSPDDHHQAAAQQALEGFVRSLGKELGRGATAQLVRLAPGADAASAESTLRFLLSPAPRTSAARSSSSPPTPPARSPTGRRPCTDAPPWSPARHAASGRPSPPYSPGTAPGSSAWTSRRPRRNSYAPPTVWAPPPCRWTSPHPTPPT